MKRKVHKNYLLASNLFFAYTISGLLVIDFSLNTLDDRIYIFACILFLFLLLGLGFLIRKGVRWIKFLLLIVIIWGGYHDYSSVLQTIQKNPMWAFLYIPQQITLIVVVVLLFKTNSITNEK